jgi:WG containing repeat
LRLLIILFFIPISSWLQAQNVNHCDSTELMALVSPSGVMTPCIYTEISNFKEGRCWVNQGELYGYIDTLLKPITEYVYTEVNEFKDHFAAVSRDSNFGFIDISGNEICELRYRQVRDFNFGFAPVLTDSLWALLDSSGVLRITPQFDYPPTVVNGDFILACRKSKWGVLNASLTEIYPFIYDFITIDGIAYLETKQVLLGAR